MSNVIWEVSAPPYTARVIRTSAYGGTLEVREGEEMLLSMQVGLSYGARFGPDVSDVADWAEMAEAACAARDREKGRAKKKRSQENGTDAHEWQERVSGFVCRKCRVFAWSLTEDPTARTKCPSLADRQGAP